MRNPVVYLQVVSLLSIVFSKGNEGYSDSEYEDSKASGPEEFQYFDYNGDGYIDRQEFWGPSSDTSIDNIVDVLKNADVDGDGKLNLEEFIQDWRYGDRREYNKLANETGLSGSSVTSQNTEGYSNIIQTTLSSSERWQKEKEIFIRTDFIQYDRSRDGYIDKKELRTRARRYRFEKDVDELMNSADVDRDGLISYNEFITSMLGSK